MLAARRMMFSRIGRVLVPWNATGWRYKQVARTDATDYSAASYNDSAWSVGQAPMGSDNIGGHAFDSWGGYNTNWDLDTRMWIRRDVGAVSPTDKVTLFYRIDNIISFWWNGVLVVNEDNNADGSNAAFPVTIPRGALDATSNILAIRATDDADTPVPDKCDIDCEVADTGLPYESILQDDFHHSNGTLSGVSPQVGATWATSAPGFGNTPRSLNISANKAVQQAYSSASQNGNISDVGATNYTATVTFVVGSNSARVNLGMFVCAKATYGDGFQIAYSGGNVLLFRTQANVSGPSVSVGTLSAGSTHTLTVIVAPIQIVVKLDGTFLFNYAPTVTEQAANGTYAGPAAYQDGSNDDGTGYFTAFLVTI